MLTSFGEEIRQTPLQPGRPDGGGLQWRHPFLLQYPQTQADVRSFVPRVKRQLTSAL